MTRPSASPGRHHNDSLGGAACIAKQNIFGTGYLSDYHDKKPVPPLSEYEAYRDTVDKRARKSIDPAKYRRITILTRNATPLGEASRLVGFSSIPPGYRKLPEHLR